MFLPGVWGAEGGSPSKASFPPLINPSKRAPQWRFQRFRLCSLRGVRLGVDQGKGCLLWCLLSYPSFPHTLNLKECFWEQQPVGKPLAVGFHEPDYTGVERPGECQGRVKEKHLHVELWHPQVSRLYADLVESAGIWGKIPCFFCMDKVKRKEKAVKSFCLDSLCSLHKG